MKKMNALAAIILTGLLLIPGQLLDGSRAWAQSGSRLSEQQRRELEQKHQEQWDYLERLDKHQENTGERLQEAEKHRRDAERRQQEAERQMREMEQRSGGKTK